MKIACPHCGAPLKVRDDQKGKVVRCAECQGIMRLEEREPSTTGALPRLDAKMASETTKKSVAPSNGPRKQPPASTGEYAEFAQSPLLPAPARRRKKIIPAVDDVDEDEETPKRRKRSARKTARGVLEGLAARPFWEGVWAHLPYMTGALFCVGGLLGFLFGLIRSETVASIVFQMIGFPTALGIFLLMSYPTACFWKVIVGSADSNGEVSEWPAGSNFAEWMFEMLLVGYMVALSVVLGMGVAKLRELATPGEFSSKEYWELIATEQEVNTIEAPQNPLFNLLPIPESVEVTSPRPVLRPGPAWETTFAAFLLIFPLVVVSCLDSDTPVFIPWSPRVFLSPVKVFSAWCLVVVMSAAILSAAAVTFVMGATYAPFWTFTLCSPLAALAMLIYARLLGLLSWQIAGT